ncbi:MAG: MerR family transcriptional regulator [Chitinophagales bacterium]|nr:MerR family transcriptional regulator [Chitinophagales bacterium]|tara:strand:- start:7 stop:342 length:336 start_codon:yes stop_codon:yes gene_type:complete
MPYKEFKIEKLYYTIGEVAKIFDVSTSLLRYWEKEFDILKPRKNKKGNRLFTKLDVKNLKMIYHLVKEKGYTLDGAKQKLSSNTDNLKNNQRIVESLQQIKLFLNEVKEDL